MLSVIGLGLGIVFCVILFASAIFISQDDFNRFMDWLTGPIFRYFERRRKAKWKTLKKRIAFEEEKIRADFQARLDKRKADIEDLKTNRLKTVEFLEKFCVKTPSNLLSKKWDSFNRGCFSIRNGYMFIIDDSGSEWLGFYNPSLMLCLRMLYEKRDLDIPIKGLGQKISGIPITIDGTRIDVYPKWFSKIDLPSASTPWFIELRSKWAGLYESFHASDLSSSWAESFKRNYTPAHLEIASYLNKTLRDAEYDIEQFQKIIKIREAVQRSWPDFDGPESIRAFMRLEAMSSSERDELISKV